MRTQNPLPARFLCAAALAAAFGALPGAASAGEPPEGYLADSAGNVVKDAYGLCWHTGYWTPAMATAECDPGLVKKTAAPVPVKETPPPAPAPAPKPPKFEKVTLKAEDLFDFDKAVLRPQGKEALDKLIAKLKEYSKVGVIVVTGYTDRIGSDAYNLRLSQRRADAVRDYLVAHGIPPGRIEAVGKGKADPIVSCSNIKGKANRFNKKLIQCLQPNRRVTVEVKAEREVSQ